MSKRVHNHNDISILQVEPKSSKKTYNSKRNEERRTEGENKTQVPNKRVKKKYYLTDRATARMIVAVTVHCKTKRKKEAKNCELIEFHIVFLLLDGQQCFHNFFKVQFYLNNILYHLSYNLFVSLDLNSTKLMHALTLASTSTHACLLWGSL